MRLLAMGWIGLSLLVALPACAGGNAASAPGQNASDVQARASQDAEEAERRQEARERREASWAEYYSDVMRRAKKHGGVVIWIAPPQVKTIETAQR